MCCIYDNRDHGSSSSYGGLTSICNLAHLKGLPDDCHTLGAQETLRSAAVRGLCGISTAGADGK